ncbi:IRF3 factor, partial [Sakesphorus luctuosus]|nr:IRF3 factor [Sakesphorus luctuosus]
RETQRQRFGPWLLGAINSGRYLGLRWVDPDRTTFRVPWKHNARKDITDSDLGVFKVGGMGVASRNLGVFKGPHAHCPAPTGLGKGKWAWKTNFRCALRSTRMFRLVKDCSKSGEDPHKVF